MEPDELKKFIKEYIKENLTIELDKDYSWGGTSIRMIVYLEGEYFTSSSTTLPNPD